ncbi:MAG: protein phosphatase 2C domain-containing protein [Planctomycetes bacterium]|nr:protein phosphatase 2C domain-containing protein [Planctomycetota bacterium]
MDSGPARDCLLTGKDLEAPGERLSSGWGDRVAWGFSPGRPNAFAAKVDPNEDALLVVERGGAILAAVADAHGGRLASETAIRSAHEAAREGAGAPSCEEVFLAAARAVAELRYEPGPDEDEEEGGIGPSEFSATALLALRCENGRTDLAWVGDCRAFRIGPGRSVSTFEPSPLWLDWESAARWIEDFERARPEDRPWSRESFVAEPGEVLLLATDGLTEPVYGVPVLGEREFAGLVRPDRALLETAHVLLHEALRNDRTFRGQTGRGGEDNVAFVLVRPM